MLIYERKKVVRSIYKRPAGGFVTLIIVVTWITAMLPTSAEAIGNKSPEDPGSLKSDLIEWSGTSCEDSHLRIRLYVPDPSIEKSVRVGSDSDCNPILEPIQSKANPGGAVALVGGGPGGNSAQLASGCGPYGNVVHSSHTLQDFARLDIAWLRTSVDRIWDCNATWLHEENDPSDRVKGWADGGPSWWKLNDPTQWTIATWYCGQTLDCTNTWARVTTTFHTDFLHCNVINQDIKLTTTTASYPDGSYWVDFQKSGSCPGVYSATSTKANVSNLRSGGYGGSGACVRAIASTLWNPPAQGPCSQQT